MAQVVSYACPWCGLQSDSHVGLTNFGLSIYRLSGRFWTKFRSNSSFPEVFPRVLRPISSQKTIGSGFIAVVLYCSCCILPNLLPAIF